MADSLSSIAVNVRNTGGHRGHIVSVNIGGEVLWLDPSDAHILATKLTDQAQEALHADRANRRRD